MTKKQNLFTFFGLAVILIGASLLFTGGDRHRSALVTAAPNATFDEAIRAIKATDGNIERVTFIRDANGTIQQVEVTFKSSGQAQLRAAVPDDKSAIQLMEASNRSGLETEIKSTNDAASPELKSVGIWLMIVQIAVPIGVIILLTWLGRREKKSSGPSSSAQTTPQQAAQGMTKAGLIEIKPDEDRKTFEDVAGCVEAKEELQHVIECLRNPELLKDLGGEPYKCVLLVGPPGNGKTLLAKAVAGEADAKFYTISGSQFTEMYVGVGAARVRDMFETIRKEKRAILFIDELDGVGRARSNGLGGNDERDSTLNQLLVEMDGFKDNQGILLMGATNRPDILDPALVRPGRFGDLQVTVDGPDKMGREQILAIHTRKTKLAQDVNLSALAANTTGFSGAGLASLIKHGIVMALRRITKTKANLKEAGKSDEEILQLVSRQVTAKDLEEGIDRVQLGPAKESMGRRMSEGDKHQTAVHELGHAWVGQSLYERGLGGDPVTKITIVPRARALGYTQSPPLDDRFNFTDKDLRARIIMSMGGRAAQELYLETIDTGASNDFKQAKTWAYRMVAEFGMSELGPISIGEGGVNPFLNRAMAPEQQVGQALMDRIDEHWVKLVGQCYEEAKKVLLEDKACFLKLVERLIEVETIMGPEFKRLRHEWSIQKN